MAIFLFAGIPVRDFTVAVDCTRGSEEVWELAEHRLVYVVQRPEHAGHATHTIIVDDLDTVEAGTAERGLQQAKREAYDNGVRKITYIDPDGNEIGYGAVPH